MLAVRIIIIVYFEWCAAAAHLDAVFIQTIIIKTSFYNLRCYPLISKRLQNFQIISRLQRYVNIGNKFILILFFGTMTSCFIWLSCEPQHSNNAVIKHLISILHVGRVIQKLTNTYHTSFEPYLTLNDEFQR